MRETRYLIGLDDTDAGDSVGTGALARELSSHLVRELAARPSGITRHQLLVHPDIPYTSHNSSACIEVETSAGIDSLSRACRDFVRFLYHPGADPGLCVAEPDRLTDACVDFGRRAQRRIVTKEEALDLAASAGILLEEHGGTGLGVVGALAGCGLRSSGEDGRFISHRGIRDVRAEMPAAEIVSETAVDVVVDESGDEIEMSSSVVTNGWVRPDLAGGRVVLRVRSIGPGRFETARKKPGADDV